MSVETELYDALAANAGVLTLVGTATSPIEARIYPAVADEDAAVPYIVYSSVGTEKYHTLAGSGDPAKYQMQINCVADTYAAGKSLAAAVIAALQANGYQQFTYDLYDETTQRHSMIIGWSFIA